jgi:hypothetical protein
VPSSSARTRGGPATCSWRRSRPAPRAWASTSTGRRRTDSRPRVPCRRGRVRRGDHGLRLPQPGRRQRPQGPRRRGLKLDDAVEDELEQLIWRAEELAGPPTRSSAARSMRRARRALSSPPAAARRAIDAAGLRVVLDGANGSGLRDRAESSRRPAPRRRLIHGEPDGVNINVATAGRPTPAALAPRRSPAARTSGSRSTAMPTGCVAVDATGRSSTATRCSASSPSTGSAAGTAGRPRRLGALERRARGGGRGRGRPSSCGPRSATSTSSTGCRCRAPGSAARRAATSSSRAHDLGRRHRHRARGAAGHAPRPRPLAELAARSRSCPSSSGRSGCVTRTSGRGTRSSGRSPRRGALGGGRVLVRPSGTEPASGSWSRARMRRSSPSSPTRSRRSRGASTLAPAATHAEQRVTRRRARRTEVPDCMCGIVGYIGPREAGPILLEGLAGSSTAATTRPGSRSSTTSGEMFVEKRAGKLANLRRRSRTGRRTPRRPGPHALGDPRPARTTSTPIRTRTARARSRSSTTASSRTSASCATARGARPRPRRPRPTPRRSPTSSRRPTPGDLADAVRARCARPRAPTPSPSCTAASRTGSSAPAERAAHRRPRRRARASSPRDVAAILAHTRPGDLPRGGRRRRPATRRRHDHRRGRHAPERARSRRRLVARGRREGRLRPLHAQGDPRAAEASPSRRRPGRPRRPDPSRSRSWTPLAEDLRSVDAGRARRLRHGLLRRRCGRRPRSRSGPGCRHGSRRLRVPLQPPPLDERTLVIAVTQSGETADTIAPTRYARERAARSSR